MRGNHKINGVKMLEPKDDSKMIQKVAQKPQYEPSASLLIDLMIFDVDLHILCVLIHASVYRLSKNCPRRVRDIPSCFQHHSCAQPPASQHCEQSCALRHTMPAAVASAVNSGK